MMLKQTYITYMSSQKTQHQKLNNYWVMNKMAPKNGHCMGILYDAFANISEPSAHRFSTICKFL